MVATLWVATLSGCSSRPTPQQLARQDATSACQGLLGLGKQVAEGQTVTSAAAVKALSTATSSANDAAGLDSAHWSVLDITVKDIQKYLETGQRTGLSGTLADLAVICKPLVPSVAG